MCGIAGFWGEVAEAADARWRLEQMAESLAHRGPDGSSCWLGHDVGLGHRRLAIIDLVTGKQPLWDATERYVIVFNGEIYNYRELRRELEAKRYTFRTQSDTEVIPAAMDAWGVEQGLKRLRGMFAFALYDTTTRRLLLARDRIGIKPLYWASTSVGVLFASEQKALLQSGLVPHRLNPVAIHDFLGQGYPTTPATCWANIQLVEPGTWLEFGPGGRRAGRYFQWHPRENESLRIEEATQNTEDRMLDTLRCHLISDVPVGVFLSGGLDSSLIVALLTKGLAPGIQTFTMGFSDPAYDESDFARLVADHCRTQHRQSKMESEEADPDLFCRILDQYDEPFGDSSCIPVYLICGEIRKHVKVVLSGDGGDEVLGGYMRYLYARRVASLARFRRVWPLFDPVFPVIEQRLGRRARRVVKAGRFAQMRRDEMLCALHACFTEGERSEMYQSDFGRLALSDGPTAARFARFIPADVSDPIQQLITAEMGLRLHADYLRKVDIASSAHGLEVRVPFLDNEMLDLAAQLPVRLKIGRSGQTKIVSRRLLRPLLPSRIAAKRKRGFDVPLDRWIGHRTREYLRELLLDPKAGVSSFLNRTAIEQVWNAFENGGVANNGSRDQRGQRLFLLASLEVWLRRWKPSLT